MNKTIVKPTLNTNVMVFSVVIGLFFAFVGYLLFHNKVYFADGIQVFSALASTVTGRGFMDLGVYGGNYFNTHLYVTTLLLLPLVALIKSPIVFVFVNAFLAAFGFFYFFNNFKQQHKFNLFDVVTALVVYVALPFVYSTYTGYNWVLFQPDVLALFFGLSFLYSKNSFKYLWIFLFLLTKEELVVWYFPLILFRILLSNLKLSWFILKSNKRTVINYFIVLFSYFLILWFIKLNLPTPLIAFSEIGFKAISIKILWNGLIYLFTNIQNISILITITIPIIFSLLNGNRKTTQIGLYIILMFLIRINLSILLFGYPRITPESFYLGDYWGNSVLIIFLIPYFSDFLYRISSAHKLVFLFALLALKIPFRTHISFNVGNIIGYTWLIANENKLYPDKNLPEFVNSRKVASNHRCVLTKNANNLFNGISGQLVINQGLAYELAYNNHILSLEKYLEHKEKCKNLIDGIAIDSLSSPKFYPDTLAGMKLAYRDNSVKIFVKVN